MFTVEVRDHIMIAHSFQGAVFGSAQALHGATFVVDAAFIAETLDSNGIVIDIGRANDALKAVLTPLNYRNLDDVPEFKGSNTTTEFLSKYIFDGLAKPARAGELGRPGRELKALRITLSEVTRRPRAIRGALVVNTSSSPCRAAPRVKSNRYPAPKPTTGWSDEKQRSAKAFQRCA